MQNRKSFVYILTNKHKTVLYIGVTSDLKDRLHKHVTGKYKGFAYKYNCFYLVYYEQHNTIEEAIKREKQIKKWRREKKNNLITSFNSEWKFLNEEVLSVEHLVAKS